MGAKEWGDRKPCNMEALEPRRYSSLATVGLVDDRLSDDVSHHGSLKRELHVI